MQWSYGSWDMEHDKINFFAILAYFLHFFPTNNLENQNLKKNEKTPRYIIILHSVPQMTIILRYGVQQTEFLYFGLFLTLLATNQKNENFEKMKKNAWRYYDFTHKYHKWKSYNVWFLRYGVQHFGPFLTHFWPHYWPWKLKFGKNIKKPGDIIFLYMCTVNEDHTMYEVWFMRYKGRETDFFVSFGPFLALWPSNKPKNQNLKKWKQHLDISSFYTCVPQIKSYDVWFLRYETWQTIFCHFGQVFVLLPRKVPKKLKFWKKIKKNTWIYYHVTHVYQKLWSVPEIQWVTDRRTNQKTEKINT